MGEVTSHHHTWSELGASHTKVRVTATTVAGEGCNGSAIVGEDCGGCIRRRWSASHREVEEVRLSGDDMKVEEYTYKENLL